MSDDFVVLQKVLTQLKAKRPQTDVIDMWNYLKYHGFKDLSLTEQEKEEIKTWGNSIAGEK